MHRPRQAGQPQGGVLGSRVMQGVDPVGIYSRRCYRRRRRLGRRQLRAANKRSLLLVVVELKLFQRLGVCKRVVRMVVVLVVVAVVL